jgi:YfiH family protein
MGAIPIEEEIAGWTAFGVLAFTSGRKHGDFRLSGTTAADDGAAWQDLLAALAATADRLVVARQVHGRDILVHASTAWRGFRIVETGADGHFTTERGTAMAVTVADCVPVFIAHPSGAVAVLHSGWRSTAAGIAASAVDVFREKGLAARDLKVHLGPAICEWCYRVGADVLEVLTGARSAEGCVDLRGILVRQFREAGVRTITVSELCTRCDNDRFFSHRAGDSGRQVGIIVVPK